MSKITFALLHLYCGLSKKAILIHGVSLYLDMAYTL